MRSSAFAEYVLDSLVNDPQRGIGNRLRHAAFSRVRAFLARDRGRLVRYNLDGTELLLPLATSLSTESGEIGSFQRVKHRIAACCLIAQEIPFNF